MSSRIDMMQHKIRTEQGFTYLDIDLNRRDDGRKDEVSSNPLSSVIETDK